MTQPPPHSRDTRPLTRDALRRVLIQDQADRDAIAAQLLRYRNEHGTAWANLVDQLSLDPDLRRRYIRWLGELEATARDSGSI